jgi:hypothetical protein
MMEQSMANGSNPSSRPQSNSAKSGKGKKGGQAAPTGLEGLDVQAFNAYLKLVTETSTIARMISQISVASARLNLETGVQKALAAGVPLAHPSIGDAQRLATAITAKLQEEPAAPDLSGDDTTLDVAAMNRFFRAGAAHSENMVHLAATIKGFWPEIDGLAKSHGIEIGMFLRASHPEQGFEAYLRERGYSLARLRLAMKKPAATPIEVLFVVTFAAVSSGLTLEKMLQVINKEDPIELEVEGSGAEKPSTGTSERALPATT